MATPYDHARSSVKRFGGTAQDYLPIHQWFDASKAFMGDFRHRALRHHAQGIFECEQVFGVLTTIVTAQALTQVPTRLIGEQHVIEDCGRIPTLQDWLGRIEPEPWMNQPRRLSQELDRRPSEGTEGT